MFPGGDLPAQKLRTGSRSSCPTCSAITTSISKITNSTVLPRLPGELVVEVEKYKTRDEARKKADAFLEKLRRGGNFQQLARVESDGTHQLAQARWIDEDDSRQLCRQVDQRCA